MVGFRSLLCRIIGEFTVLGCGEVFIGGLGLVLNLEFGILIELEEFFTVVG